MNYDLDASDKELLDRVTALLNDENLPDPAALQRVEASTVGSLLRAWLQRLGPAGYLAAPAGPGLTSARMLLAARSPWLALAVAIGPGLLADLLARVEEACRRALDEARIDRYDTRGNVVATEGYATLRAYGRAIERGFGAPRFVLEKHLIAYGAALLAGHSDQATAVE